MLATPPLTPSVPTGCMTWPATCGSGPGTSTKDCTIATCAEARRTSTRWTCASGCATVPRPRTSVRVSASVVPGLHEESIQKARRRSRTDAPQLDPDCHVGAHSVKAIRARLRLYWPLTKSLQTGLLLSTGLAGGMRGPRPGVPRDEFLRPRGGPLPA